jgi:hypothetical protein
VSDLGAEGAVVHEQHLQVFGVVDHELLQPVGEEEFGSIVRTVTDLGHLLVAPEASPHTVVDACISFALPRGLLQLSATRPPYRSDWKRVNLRVRFFTMRFLRRGVDFTIRLFYQYFPILFTLNHSPLSFQWPFRWP